MARIYLRDGLVIKEKFAYLPVIYRVDVYGIKGIIWLCKYYEYRVPNCDLVFRDKCNNWESIESFCRGY